MFHVNAWGVPYAAAMTGAKLVFPGQGMDGASLWELIEAEKPDLLLGVPTVWLMLLNHMDEIGKKLDSVENVVVGGSAAPLSMIKKFEEVHSAFLIHAWGMTEMSPLGTANVKTLAMANMPLDERYKIQLKQGKPVFGVEMKIVDDEGNPQPHDGISYGRLLVRGPWIINKYYNNEDMSSFENGWLDTGDVATIDPDHYLGIVDRSKDVIKSGGEWISSIDLENEAVGHPDIIEACVIGVAHEKWDERPLLLVIRKPQSSLTSDDIKAFLADKIAKWWMPDDVIFVDSLPHTATGKLLKINLRKEYQNYLLNC
jgi:fatty-acyl-CoA synthase